MRSISDFPMTEGEQKVSAVILNDERGSGTDPCGDRVVVLVSYILYMCPKRAHRLKKQNPHRHGNNKQTPSLTKLKYRCKQKRSILNAAHKPHKRDKVYSA